MAKASIIIPAFNAATTLNATLDSVAGQSHADWEAIIFDDSSMDATSTLAKAWCDRDRRFRLISGKARGVAAARNQAVQYASAPWLLFLDSDDLITQEHLAVMLAAASREPKSTLIYSAGARLTPDGRIGAPQIPPRSDLFQRLASYCTFYIHACLVRRAAFEDLGGFDTTLRTCEDWDLWQRFARTGAILTPVDECLALYRMRPGSLSHDAERLFKDARNVILRGHGKDSRVRNPAPSYAEGLPQEHLEQALAGIVIYCAAIMIGSGKDPVPFLQRVESLPPPKFDISGSVSIMQGDIPNGACALQEDWPVLWPTVKTSICNTFTILEQRFKIPDFVSSCMNELERRLRASPKWADKIDRPAEMPSLNTAPPTIGKAQPDDFPRRQQIIKGWQENRGVAVAFIRNIKSPDVSSVMVVAAHPDDEVIGAGAHLSYWPGLTVVHVTNGVPNDERYSHEAGFPDQRTYAAARRREAVRALSIAGLGPERVIGLEFVDQEASLQLLEVARRLAALFVTMRPAVVVTHPYEGGHPDHDAASFAVQAACRLVERGGGLAPALVEMSSYFSRQGTWVTSSFLDDEPLSTTIELDETDRGKKRQMMLCHASQKALMRIFPIAIECFRPAPSYDFLRPPHSGRLSYEYGSLGMDGVRWRAMAAAALVELAKL